MNRNIGIVCLFFLICALPSGLFAQRIAMLDIKGHKDSFIQRFSEGKVFFQVKDIENKPTLRGKIKDDSVSLLLYVSPHTQRVYQVDVRFQSFNKWGNAKRFYVKHLKGYQSKYGEVKVSKREFQKPYCDGGGKEFEAIKKGKAIFSDDWGDMPYIQNLQLLYFMDGDGYPVLRYKLKDEFMKYEEERKLTPPSLF